MKPSDIELTPVPLCGTMKKAEREFAAALIVRTCHVLGDAWQPISLEQLQRVLKDDLAAKREPFASWCTNPFFRPDFHRFADGMFGRWTGDPGASPIEFTERGLEAIKPWAKDHR
jgi:hypothetical protein